MRTLLLFVSLTALFSHVASAQTLREPRRGGTLRIHALYEPDDLGYVTSTDAFAQEIQSLIFESLTTVDPVTLMPVPLLAEKLPVVSADRLSYELRIRKDARFGDGRPVTAHDVIFYLKTVKNPYILNAAPTRGYYERIDRAEIVGNDPRRLRVVLTEPYHLGAEWVGTLVALPKHVLDPKGLTDRMTFAQLNDNDVDRNPAIPEFANWMQERDKGRTRRFLMGSGPYRFDEWSEGERVVVVRNERYWNAKDPTWGRAYPDTIAWQIINFDGGAVDALMEGSVDVLPALDKSRFATVRPTLDLSRFRPVVYEGTSYSYVGWNNDHPIFGDARVRRALSHAIDRETIRKHVYFGYAHAATSFIYPGRPEYDSTLRPVTYDLEAARVQLTEAGWSDSDGDGVLDKVIDGVVTPFRFTILLNSGNEKRATMARIIAGALRTLGIEARTDALDWALFLDRTRDHEFDAYIGGWAQSVTETDPYNIWHSSQSSGGSNYVQFASAEADSLIELMRTEVDLKKRIAMNRRLQRIIDEEQPYAFLMREQMVGLMSRRVRTFAFHAPRPGYNPAWWSLE
jgi:peptide/nickel transport system substrate-binding protein